MPIRGPLCQPQWTTIPSGGVPLKIDIGNGKILGTKRVSQNGQISGFTEYSGREVLVILPEGEPTVKLDAKEYIKEVQTAAHEQMKLVFLQYREIKKKFDTPEKATKNFLEKYAPKSVQGVYEKMETWTKDNVSKAETKVEKALKIEENGAAPAEPKTTPEA